MTVPVTGKSTWVGNKNCGLPVVELPFCTADTGIGKVSARVANPKRQIIIMMEAMTIRIPGPEFNPDLFIIEIGRLNSRCPRPRGSFLEYQFASFLGYPPGSGSNGLH